jgi:hypothetical protein
MFVLIIIQLPIVLWQFFILDLRTDLATGSLRTSGIGMILEISMICIFSRLFLDEKKSILYILIIMSMFIFPIIGESKAFFLFLPIIYLFSFRKQIYLSPFSTTVLLTVMVLVFSFAIKMYGEIPGNVTNLKQTIYNPSMLVENEGYAFSTLGRIQTIASANEKIHRDFFTTLFGFGIGSKILTASEIYSSTKTSFTRVTNLTYLENIIYELGYIGIILFFLFKFKIAVITLNINKIATDPFWEIISSVFVGIILLYVISIFYTNITNDIAQCFFWSLFGCIIHNNKRDIIHLRISKLVQTTNGNLNN